MAHQEPTDGADDTREMIAHAAALLGAYLEDHLITQSAFARHLGVSQGLVWQWLHQRRPIAGRHAIPIELYTKGGISRTQIRPDLYPLERAA
jgi:hypothetical protein